VVNKDPYEDGWLAVIQAAAWDVDRVGLLGPPGYLSIVQSQAEQELNQP
jgi:glycine cleavage system H lipoate-binding protein